MKTNVIGKQISFLRNKYGMTQEDLGIKLGVSKQTISNWETGLKTPRMGSIQKLAALFNVKKSFIIEGVEDSTEEIFNIYEKLNEQRKNEVVDFAKFKLQEQQKEEKNHSNLAIYNEKFNRPKIGPFIGSDDEVKTPHIDDDTTEEDTFRVQAENINDDATEEDIFRVQAAHIDDDATEEDMEEINNYKENRKNRKKD